LSSFSAADVDAAAGRIAGVVTPTPLQLSDRLSATTGANVYLKREDLQTVRSYKLRGAYNLLVQLSDEEVAAGVVCSSAGNHAQGFAFACRTLGIRGRVYVPAKPPKQKRDRIRYHGGQFLELIVGGTTYDLAAEAALADVERTGATLVPPFDAPRTMAGQGTIAVEILSQLDGEPDLVVVPVGGGGCIAGITTYLAERTSKTSVLGIEPAGAAAMMAALANGGPVTLDHVDQFVDGAAVSRAGRLTYAALAAAGNMVSITTVDEGAVCTAMLDLYKNGGLIAEPAGALAVPGYWKPTSNRVPRWCAWCLAATTTCRGTAKYSSGRWSTSGSSTTSWSTSRKSPARCAASWTACSVRMTTSRCSSTSSATTGRPVRRWWVSSWARQPAWTVCWNACGPLRCRSRRSNRVRRPTAICCRRARFGRRSPHRFDCLLRLGQPGAGDAAVFLDRGDHVARAGKRDHCGRHPGGTGLREGHVAVGEQRLELRFDVIETGSGAVVDFTHPRKLPDRPVLAQRCDRFFVGAEDRLQRDGEPRSHIGQRLRPQQFNGRD